MDITEFETRLLDLLEEVEVRIRALISELQDEGETVDVRERLAPYVRDAGD